VWSTRKSKQARPDVESALFLKLRNQEMRGCVETSTCKFSCEEYHRHFRDFTLPKRYTNLVNTSSEILDRSVEGRLDNLPSKECLFSSITDNRKRGLYILGEGFEDCGVGVGLIW